MSVDREAILERIKECGIVGAGGAGFPTHVKYRSPLKTLVVNGAECEPLLYKDKELMRLHASEMIAAMDTLRTAGFFENAIVGVKKKAKETVLALKTAIKGLDWVQIFELGNFYPSGDEIVLIKEVLGIAVPHRQLPSYNGVVVNNCETLLNIQQGLQGHPVTETWISLCGAVSNPITLKVPVGTPLSEVLPLAGKLLPEDPVFLKSGVMMGQYGDNFDEPITRTTAGFIFLDRNHPLIARHTETTEQFLKVGHSACDQCSYCTELCPRYLLGHKIEPHKVMRALLFNKHESTEISRWASGCVECGVCGLFACPENLSPHKICGHYKRLLSKDNRWFPPETESSPHPMGEYRKVNVKKLLKRLHIDKYDVPAPYQEIVVTPKRVILPLGENIGAPSIPLVAVGASVVAGQKIADAGEGLSAVVIASITGVVESVDATKIVIRRSIENAK